MGRSEAFERWRIVQAGAVAWFYDGPGDNFGYWPEGLDGPICAEQPPFHNVAILADNDAPVSSYRKGGPTRTQSCRE
jgi:hypothetical protein